MNRITEIQNLKRLITKRKKQLVKWKQYAFSRDLFEFYALGGETKKWILPRNLPEIDPDNSVPSLMFGNFGLEINLKEQLKRLSHWRKNYNNIFIQIREDPTINVEFLGKGYLHNSFYPTPDAEIYASMILDYKPDQIIEVGSGFSTLIAKKIKNLNRMNFKIQIIDPEPRTDIENDADKIMYKYVEDINISEMAITDHTLFFIDSSHIIRGLGDVPHLYCKIISNLPSDTLIHVHDIFLPYEYPITYLKRFYTEQYILHALLAHSTRYEIVFTTHYLTRKYPEEMQKTFGSIVGTHNRFFGGSFWFRIK